MKKKVKGAFITFEGAEGAGKSTQVNLIRKHLQAKGLSIVFAREPGGVKISEKIRRILLDVNNEGMSREAETLLYMAARAQLIQEVIEPALKAGKAVLCDRFLDSTVAYQGYGHNMDIDFIKQIGHFATKGIVPDLTFIFDIDSSLGLSRIKRKKDRIEQRVLSYHKRVRKGYLDLAKKEPKRIKLIKVNRSKEEIHWEVAGYVDALI